jgi:hypothetical protein
MRFVARVDILVFAILFAAAIPVCADSKDCASPPGPRGTIRCESDQMAICEAKLTRVDAQCLDKGGRTGKKLAARLLTAVFHRQITEDEVEREEYQRVLREGRVKRPDGTVVTFSYEDDEEPTSTPPSNEPTEEPPSFTCTACVAVDGKNICETETGATKDEASQAAAKSLAGRLVTLLGVPKASKLGNPSIECKQF